MGPVTMGKIFCPITKLERYNNLNVSTTSILSKLFENLGMRFAELTLCQPQLRSMAVISDTKIQCAVISSLSMTLTVG
jgi:hypothetical protein